MLKHAVPITLAGLLAVFILAGFWRAHVLSDRDIGVLTGQVDAKVRDWDARKVPQGRRVINFVISDSSTGNDPFVEAPDPTQWQRTMMWLGHSIVGGAPAESSLTPIAEAFQGEPSAVTWVHGGFSKVSEEAMEREVGKALLKAHDSGAEIDFTIQGPGAGSVLSAIKKVEGIERGGVKVGANKVILVGTNWPRLKQIPSLSAYDFRKPGNIIELANIWIPKEEFVSRTAVLHLRAQDGSEKETAMADLWPDFAGQGGTIEKLCRLVRQFATMVESLQQTISKQEQTIRESAAREAAEHAAKIAEEAHKAAEETARWQAEARRLAEEAAKREAAARRVAEEAAQKEAEARIAVEAAAKANKHKESPGAGTAAGIGDLMKKSAQCCGDVGGSWIWGRERGYCNSKLECQALHRCCNGADWPSNYESIPSCREASTPPTPNGIWEFRCARP